MENKWKNNILKPSKCASLPTMAALELYNFPQQLIFSKGRNSIWGHMQCPKNVPGYFPHQDWRNPPGQCRLSSEMSGFQIWEWSRGCCRRGCIPNRSRHKPTPGSTRSQACSTSQSYEADLSLICHAFVFFFFFFLQAAWQAWLLQHIENCHVKAHDLFATTHKKLDVKRDLQLKSGPDFITDNTAAGCALLCLYTEGA